MNNNEKHKVYNALRQVPGATEQQFSMALILLGVNGLDSALAFIESLRLDAERRANRHNYEQVALFEALP